MEPDNHTPIELALAELSVTERGFVLAALLAGEEQPAAATATVAEPAATRCRAALTAAAALPRPERLRYMSVLAREAMAPLPAGLDAVQPDVLVTALQREPAFIIRAVTAQAPPVLQAAGAAVLGGDSSKRESDGKTSDSPLAQGAGFPAAAMIAELQRALFVDVVAVSPAPPGVAPNRLGRRLALLSGDALLTEVTATGADVLGASLRGAGENTLKRALLHAGATWSDRISRAARDTGTADDSAEGRTATAQARTLTSAVTPGLDPQETLSRIGARACGSRLKGEDPDLIRAVAQRLPPTLRRELLTGAKLGGT